MCAVFRVLQVRLIKWAKKTLFFNAIQNTYQLPCVGRWFPTFSRTWSRLQISLHPEDWRPHPIRASSEPGMWHPASRETWPIDASTNLSSRLRRPSLCPLAVGAKVSSETSLAAERNKLSALAVSQVHRKLYPFPSEPLCAILPD